MLEHFHVKVGRKSRTDDTTQNMFKGAGKLLFLKVLVFKVAAYSLSLGKHNYILF